MVARPMILEVAPNVSAEAFEGSHMDLRERERVASAAAIAAAADASMNPVAVAILAFHAGTQHVIRAILTECEDKLSPAANRSIRRVDLQYDRESPYGIKVQDLAA